MSRSRKKTPVKGIGGHSDKIGKSLANRMFRRRERMAVHSRMMHRLPYRTREVYDVWSMPKDGKFYFGEWEHNNEHKDDFERNIRK